MRRRAIVAAVGIIAVGVLAAVGYAQDKVNGASDKIPAKETTKKRQEGGGPSASDAKAKSDDKSKAAAGEKRPVPETKTTPPPQKSGVVEPIDAPKQPPSAEIPKCANDERLDENGVCVKK